MKYNFYGKKMLAIDLTLVSVWAFFFSRYCSAILLILIPMRIALCFQMRSKSPWALVSALGFFIAYCCSGNVAKPFEKIFYTFFCAIGESGMMTDIFSKPLEIVIQVWLALAEAIGFIWIAMLPLFAGLQFRFIKDVDWKRKWIWIYFVPLTTACVWVMFNVGVEGGFLWGVVIALLPLFYWSIYQRNGRSAVELILRNKEIAWYGAYALLMMGALTIGLKDISSLKLIGLMTLPALFYVMLTRSMHLGKVLTRCCIALAIAGWFYWLALDANKWQTIFLLGAAICLIIFVGVTMIYRSRKFGAPLILMTVTPIFLAPCILGMNPYVAVDADHTRLYASNVSVRNGVYVLEKHEDCYYGRYLGLRDRYGLILPMEYDEFGVADRYGDYLITLSHVGIGCLIKEQRYGFFDLRRRKFVVDPKKMDIAEIKKIDDRSYQLIDPEEREFAILYLPGVHPDTGMYMREPLIKPYPPDSRTEEAESQ